MIHFSAFFHNEFSAETDTFRLVEEIRRRVFQIVQKARIRVTLEETIKRYQRSRNMAKLLPRSGRIICSTDLDISSRQSEFCSSSGSCCSQRGRRERDIYTYM